MKISCEIIKDILPLYAEELCSDETRQFVEEHLKRCEVCTGLADDSNDHIFDISDSKNDDEKSANILQEVKKKLQNSILFISFAVVLWLVVIRSVVTYYFDDGFSPVLYSEIAISAELQDNEIFHINHDRRFSTFHAINTIVERNGEEVSVILLFYTDTFMARTRNLLTLNNSAVNQLYTQKEHGAFTTRSEVWFSPTPVLFSSNSSQLENLPVTAIYYLNINNLESLISESNINRTINSPRGQFAIFNYALYLTSLDSIPENTILLWER